MTVTGLLQHQHYHLVTSAPDSALIINVTQSAVQVHRSRESPEMKGCGTVQEGPEKGVCSTEKTPPKKIFSLQLEPSGGPWS